MGFLVTEYFQGRPQLYFIAGSAGLVNLQETSKVSKGISNSSSLASTSSSTL